MPHPVAQEVCHYIGSQTIAARKAVTRLQEAGGTVYAVGGAVRDLMIGKTPNDVDLMVTGLDQHQVSIVLKRMPGWADFTGKDFGVFRYRWQGDEVEIALPRKERSTGEGNKDFEVEVGVPVLEDLKRRDFTCNSMAVDVRTGELIDPFNAEYDIRQGYIRLTNEDAFLEDPLRILRAFVLMAKAPLIFDFKTDTLIRSNRHLIQSLSKERVQWEIDKIMKTNAPAVAIDNMQRLGVLEYVFPELARTDGFDQNNKHHEQMLFDHMISVLYRISRQTDDPDLRLAALLHDVGKPASEWKDEEGQSHYYLKKIDEYRYVGDDHEKVGALMVDHRLHELRYPVARAVRIAQLVRFHMWPLFTSEKGARKFLARVGEYADDLLTLREADKNASVQKQRELVERVRKAEQATDLSQLAINGHDLIEVGVPKGPEIGRLLRYLTELVVTDPSYNTKDKLLHISKGIVESGRFNILEDAQYMGEEAKDIVHTSIAAYELADEEDRRVPTEL